ncbi:IS4 family transposase [Pleurocapsales cyanobacterium LEGE 10410]|nr:IS4 family transposase [Pleurocapsales cyanobacterium LEGE 10410]
MDNVSLLRNTLKPYLKWHGARLSFLALFLIALFRVKTVNLVDLSLGFKSKAKKGSSYKRLQRFLREFDIDYYSMAKLVIEMMEIPQPWVLSLARTEWQFGSKVFNILTLGVVHQGVAFPLLWWMLDKKGNSNTIERIELLKEFVELFHEYQIAYLSADREFLGHDWLQYLLSQPMMPFRIRIRETELVGDGKHQLSTRIVFSHLQMGQKSLLKRKRILWGHQVYIGALRLQDNSLLTIIAPNYCHTAINDYAQRWGIETLFGIFKSRGFNLEDTHLIDSERLSRLFALLTSALCWAYRTGQWLSNHKPIVIKKHGRKAKSIFRYGFDYLRSIFLNLDESQADFLQSLKFLSCT